MGWHGEAGLRQWGVVTETLRMLSLVVLSGWVMTCGAWGLELGEAAEQARPFSVQMPYDLPPRVEAGPSISVPPSSQPLGPEDLKPGEQIVTKGTVLVQGQEAKG